MKPSTDSLWRRAGESLQRRELIKPAVDFKGGLADSVNKSIYTSAIHRWSESAFRTGSNGRDYQASPTVALAAGRVITEDSRDHKHKGRTINI